MNVNEMYDLLIEYGVSVEAINLVANINGWNEQTMFDILYVKFGYHDFEDLKK